MAAKFFLKQYRAGKLGQFTLDDVSPEALDTFFETQKMYKTSTSNDLSRRQEKKLAKLEQRKQARNATNGQH
ncbi:hypothetical protein G6F57_023126 [Rhizopus arrhizus]|nr:hypothetical protein G6F57_023126 [Rhizopus arrhizus]